MGIRAEESATRARLPAVDYNHKDKWLIVKPIFHWTEAEIWEFIEHYELPYCSLYDEDGFSRLGCIICPYHTPKQKALYRKRWSKQWDLFIKKIHENWHIYKEWESGTKYNSPDELFEYWCNYYKEDEDNNQPQLF